MLLKFRTPFKYFFDISVPTSAPHLRDTYLLFPGWSKVAATTTALTEEMVYSPAGMDWPPTAKLEGMLTFNWMSPALARAASGYWQVLGWMFRNCIERLRKAGDRIQED